MEIISKQDAEVVKIEETYDVRLTRDEMERIFALSFGGAWNGCNGVRGSGEGGDTFPHKGRLCEFIPDDIKATAAERFDLVWSPPGRGLRQHTQPYSYR